YSQTFFFFQAEDGIRDRNVTGVQTCALPIFLDFAVSRGADRQMLIERSHIPLDDLKNQDNRIPLANYMALLKAGIELCDEPALRSEERRVGKECRSRLSAVD